MKQKFYPLTVSKAHESMATVVSAIACTALEAHAAAAAAAAADVANGGKKHPRTQAPLGAPKKTPQKTTAENAGGACATLFFA